MTPYMMTTAGISSSGTRISSRSHAPHSAPAKSVAARCADDGLEHFPIPAALDGDGEEQHGDEGGDGGVEKAVERGRRVAAADQ